MRARLVTLWIVLAASAMPHAAEAICGAPPPVQSLPRVRSTVPRNAQIAMMMPAELGSGSALSIRTAPVRGRGRINVPITSAAGRKSGTFELTVLVPTQLAPRTAYEVVGPGDKILSVFTTNDAMDRTAPTWSGLKRGFAWRPPPKKPAGPITIPPECGSALVTVHMDKPATDDQTPAKDIRYALWAVPASASIDYTKFPVGWVDLDVDLAARLTRPGTPPDFFLEYGNDQDGLDTFTIPTERPLKIGVRAIDLAGNASTPSELTLK